MRGESVLPMSCPRTGSRGGQGRVDLADVLHAGQGRQGGPGTAGHHH